MPNMGFLRQLVTEKTLYLLKNGQNSILFNVKCDLQPHLWPTCRNIDQQN